MSYVLVACLLLVCALQTASAAPSKLAAPTAQFKGPTAMNTSTLVPYGYRYTTYCNWVSGALTTFSNNNAGWNFTWAGPVNSAFSKNDFTVNQYDAYVVTQPTNKLPNTYKSNFQNADAGGAIFVLTYQPQNGNPTNGVGGITLHWVQAYNESLKGGPFTSSLDVSAKAKTDKVPWYDDGYAAGFGGNNSFWFQDRPYDSIGNSPANVQFQMFLAADKVVGGVNDVTLYGGEWWGYTYSATPTPDPEPSTLFLLGSGVAGVGGLLRKRMRNRS